MRTISQSLIYLFTFGLKETALSPPKKKKKHTHTRPNRNNTKMFFKNQQTVGCGGISSLRIEAAEKQVEFLAGKFCCSYNHTILVSLQVHLTIHSSSANRFLMLICSYLLSEAKGSQGEIRISYTARKLFF